MHKLHGGQPIRTTRADAGLRVAEPDFDRALGRRVENPDTVNHAIIEFKFSDGATWYIETTTYEFVTYEKAYGWRYAWR